LGNKKPFKPKDAEAMPSEISSRSLKKAFMVILSSLYAFANS
jgi:hypothetical protein